MILPKSLGCDWSISLLYANRPVYYEIDYLILDWINPFRGAGNYISQPSIVPVFEEKLTPILMMVRESAAKGLA